MKGFSLALMIGLTVTAAAQQVAISTLPGETVNILLTEKQGNSVKQYLGKLDGILRVDASGRVVGLSGKILALETADNKSMPVTKSEVQDGTLLITTKEGALYQIYDMKSSLAGSIKLVKAATGSNTPSQPKQPVAQGNSGTTKTVQAPGRSIAGKVYINSDGDTIEFRSNGKATERNARPGMAYPHQGVDFDANGRPSTACTYTQSGNKISLTCDEGVTADFTVNSDGSLAGPSTGMFNHPAFARLTKKK